MKEVDKALQGLPFSQGDPTLAEERTRAKDLCFRFNHTIPSNTEERNEIIRELIGNIKGSFIINTPFYCDYGKYITIGDKFFCNYDLKILDGGPVTFGNDVRIGPGCSFITANHAMDPEERREGYMIFEPITVEDNVWFGSSVTVLPGVHIGKNSVIAAGSVVSKDIPENVLAGGVPCKVIRPIGDNERSFADSNV